MSLNYTNKSFNNSELSGVISHLNIHITGVTMMYRGRVAPLNEKTDSTATADRHVGSTCCCCCCYCYCSLYHRSSIFTSLIWQPEHKKREKLPGPGCNKMPVTLPARMYLLNIVSEVMAQTTSFCRTISMAHADASNWPVQMINMPHNIQIRQWRTNYGETSPADGRMQPMKSSNGALHPSCRKHRDKRYKPQFHIPRTPPPPPAPQYHVKQACSTI
jgi:hypothetical protein